MQTKYYFPLSTVRDAFVAQVHSHGSIIECAIKLRISYDTFSKVKLGRLALPWVVLDKLKLEKVCNRNVIKGYCGDSDIDWNLLWQDSSELIK